MRRSIQDSLEWEEIIDSKGGYHILKIKEIWQYRHLLKMFIWRDIVVTYQQTVLGPLWFVIQPILTTYIFALVFGRFAKLSSDGQPQALFYFSGVILWSFFNESFLKISASLKTNAGMMKKIYFPRLILPLTTIAASLIRFLIQYIGFLLMLAFFMGSHDGGPSPNAYVWLSPLLILIIAMFSMGIGLLISSLTIRYRDLVFLISFGVTLFMYITPVIYPQSAVPIEYRLYTELNPMSAPIECFRHAYLGSGEWIWPSLFYSAAVSMGMMFIGLKMFNKSERSFIDTI